MISTLLLTILVGALLLAAVATLVHAIWITVTWTHGSGVIVGYEESQADAGGTMFHPKFVIDGDEPNPSPTISTWGSWRKPWPIGATVDIRIHPTDKHRVEIKCFANLFGIPATLAGLSAVAGILLYISIQALA